MIQKKLVDKVGFGESFDYEDKDNDIGTPVVKPENNQSIERHPGGGQGNGQDTNNNNADFFIQTIVTPRNSTSPHNQLLLTIRQLNHPHILHHLQIIQTHKVVK